MRQRKFDFERLDLNGWLFLVFQENQLCIRKRLFSGLCFVVEQLAIILRSEGFVLSLAAIEHTSSTCMLQHSKLENFLVYAPHIN